MLIAVAVSMLGVLVDTSYTPRPSNLALVLQRLAKSPYSYTARCAGFFSWQADLE
jgi:hypothetical protein